MNLCKGQLLGPVEGADQSYMFSSVLVKHPVTGDSAWVNVWTRGNNRGEPKGVRFCVLISASKAESKWLKKETKQQTLGVSYPIDLESDDDDFVIVAAEPESITEAKETLGSPGRAIQRV